MFVLSLIVAGTLGAQDMVKRSFHPDGQVKEVMEEEGFRTYYSAYYENGRVSQQGSFWKGKPDGTWRQYNEQGSLICRVKFDDGKRTGVWVVGEVNGRSRLMLKYRADKLEKISRVDEKGEMVVVRENF